MSANYTQNVHQVMQNKKPNAVIQKNLAKPRVPIKQPRVEPESDCIDDTTFFKYLNLVPERQLRLKTFDELGSTFPLRTIARTSPPNCRPDIRLANRDELLSQRQSPSVNAGLFNPIMNANFQVKKQSWECRVRNFNAQLQKLHMPEAASLPEEVRRQRQMDLKRLQTTLLNEKKEHEELRELHQLLTYYFSKIECCSPLGQRVLQALNQSSLDATKMFRLLLEIEEYCHTSDRSLLQSVTAPNGGGPARITRANIGIEGVEKMWGPRLFHHQYSFNKMQRMEKYKRLETGLDWKGRLLALSLKPVKVVVEKILTCPCCHGPVDPEVGHSCGNPEELAKYMTEDVDMENEAVRSNDEEPHTCSVSYGSVQNGYHYNTRNSYRNLPTGNDIIPPLLAKITCQICEMRRESCRCAETGNIINVDNNDIVIKELKNDAVNRNPPSTPVLVFSNMSSPSINNLTNSNTVLVKTCNDSTTITLPRKTPRSSEKLKSNENIKLQPTEHVRITPLNSKSSALVLSSNKKSFNRSISVQPSDDIVIVQEVRSPVKTSKELVPTNSTLHTVLRKPKQGDSHFRIQQLL